MIFENYFININENNIEDESNKMVKLFSNYVYIFYLFIINLKK